MVLDIINLQVLLIATNKGLQERTYWVEHEAVDPLAGGDNHHGGAAIEGVACSYKVPPRLQGVPLAGFIICGLRETV